ncbi:microcompartment protein [Thermohalobacter berrensis]|uniref:Microcompartment protein n=1 Tax=Thermohalobacter berrensis TaxID=99594 RepID=A0A419T275_9FIRM|nr:microcompartment protein [Thermohalobacter berrensis]
MKAALGLIETVGLTTAITALDAASKAADVTLVGYEKVIGAGKAVSVTIQFVGEVAAVKASVEAGVNAGSRVGTVLSHRVIPRPHEEVDSLIKRFEKNIKKKESKKTTESKTKKDLDNKN